MPLNCKFEELDDETRGHLLAVRRANGRGAPGVYASVPNQRPVWGLGCGVVVLFLFLIIGAASRKGPAAVAAVETAGVLAGGWLILYAIRRWMGAGGPAYPGTFLYFDPLHVYEVLGEDVKVTDLDGVNSILAKPGPRVAFQFDRGNVAFVPTPTMRVAERVEEYYGAMAELEDDAAGPWAKASAAELGAGAIYAAKNDALPRDTSDIRLEIEPVPAEPRKGNRAGAGLLGLALIPAAGAGLFLMFFGLNHATRDDAAFGDASANGAPGLRLYLLDERNTKHREEAKELLARTYDAPVNKLRTTTAGKSPELRDAMVKLVESLREADSPAVSIRVVEAGDPAGQTLQTDVADSLARSIGPELIAFAAAPPDTPAMVEVVCSVDPVQATHGAVVTIRTSHTAPPLATGTIGPFPAANVLNGTALRDAILVELAGGYTPAPPPDDGGEF